MNRWAWAALLLAIAGCQTMEGGGYGRSAFGNPPEGRNGPAPVRIDPRTEAARTQTRLEQLEAVTRRLQAQVDGLADSQPQLTAQSEARLAQARQDAETARAEVETLRREVAALRTEQQQLRKGMDDLPTRISKAVAASVPAPAATPPARRPPAASSGARVAATSGAAVGLEHVVEPGQTLSDIALAYKVRVDAILRENKLKDANSIRVGQKLFIPKS